MTSCSEKTGKHTEQNVIKDASEWQKYRTDEAEERDESVDDTDFSMKRIRYSPIETFKDPLTGGSSVSPESSNSDLKSPNLSPKTKEPEEHIEQENHDGTELRIITWNVDHQVKNKAKALKEFIISNKSFVPDIIFFQEVYLDEKSKTALNKLLTKEKKSESKGWHFASANYKKGEKGVAILIKESMEPTIHSSEVDRNGRYVVVQCNLNGQDYTLVSVYNHKHDTYTLDLLIPYLQKKTRGILVIGGDFNTTFTINDRAKKTLIFNKIIHCDKDNPSHARIRPYVKRFMRDLLLVDIFREKHGDDFFCGNCFTYRQNLVFYKYGMFRLDYFFIPKGQMFLATKCEMMAYSYTDHSPLLLVLDVKSKKPVAKAVFQKHSSIR